MSHDDVNRYRKAAEECRSLAAKTVDPIEKDRLLRMAEDWLMLAVAPPISRNYPQGQRGSPSGHQKPARQ
jgi:hypothetical protein